MLSQNNSNDAKRTIFLNSHASAADIEKAIETKRKGHFYGTLYLCVTDNIVTDENKGKLLDNASANMMYEILEFRDDTMDVWHNGNQMTNRVSVKEASCAIYESMLKETATKE